MAKRTYKCLRCERVQQLVGPRSASVVCDTCGEIMVVQMPIVSKPTVHESPDKQSGKLWLDDHAQVMKDRKENYYWAVLVPRMVQSGVYSMETILQNGWAWIDDAGHMHVYDKPPSRR